MDSIVMILTILCVFLYFVAMALLYALLRTTKEITNLNKQLLIMVAGKEEKVETMRALVASDRKPKKDIGGGVSNKKEKKPDNKDYTMTVGVS